MNTKITVFLIVVAALLAIAGLAARNARSKGDMLIAGRQVSSLANGLAIAGEFAAVATFLGLVGSVSLGGFSGFIGVLGVPTGFLVLLVVIAEPLRRAGHYTVADIFAQHMPSVLLRMVVGVTGLVISALFLIGQFVGGASVIGTFFGFSYGASVLIIGGLTFVLVLAGGMRTATTVQVVKTVLLLAASLALLLLALRRTSWDPLDLPRTAALQLGHAAIAPQHGDQVAALDNLSAVIATALGIAGMPHIAARLLTVRSATAARRSGLIALWTMSGYLTLMGFVGYAAAQIVGRRAISAQSPGGSAATVQLAAMLGGDVFASIVAGLVFAIIAAVLAGLLVSMMAILSHDLFGQSARGRRASDRTQVVVARLGACVVTVLVCLLSFGARNINLIFVGTFTFGVAASTIFPVIVYSLYWRAFGLPGAMTALTVGLLSSVALLVLGPNVLGTNAPFAYSQPALFTIPLAFASGWAATVLTARPANKRVTPVAAPIRRQM
jgi:cation/acetate symporter